MGYAKRYYSVEIDKYNPTVLGECLRKLEEGIPNFEYDWYMHINAGGIDYGIYRRKGFKRSAKCGRFFERGKREWLR